MYKSQDGLRSE